MVIPKKILEFETKYRVNKYRVAFPKIADDKYIETRREKVLKRFKNFLKKKKL